MPAGRFRGLWCAAELSGRRVCARLPLTTDEASYSMRPLFKDLEAIDEGGQTPLRSIPRDSSVGFRVYRYLMKHIGNEFQASFDCDAARDVIDKLICVDQEIAGLDKQMAMMLNELNSLGSNRLRHELKIDQQQWRSQRYERCSISRAFYLEDSAFWEALKCMKEDYKNRIWELTGHKNMLKNQRKMNL